MKKFGLILLSCLNTGRTFQYPGRLRPKFRVDPSLPMAEPTEGDLSYLEKELTLYLRKRNEVNADARAQK